MASNDGLGTHQGGANEVEPEPLAAHRTNTMSEKPLDEKLAIRQDGQLQYAHIDESIAKKIAANVDDFMTLVNEANEANERERCMKLSTAFKTYPKAIAWSMILSSCLIMEGYDTAIIGSYTAYPSFRDRFGTLGPSGEISIPSSWQNGISIAANVGEIIGLQWAGWASERYGYRYTIVTALVAITGFIFLPFFAKSLTVFLLGEFFEGLSWGVFQTMTTAYAAEVCPVPLRHYLTVYVNLCWIIGQFISSGVLVVLEPRQDEWGYKIPFAIQWIWPIPIAIGCLLAPESPWWCVRNGRKEQAERSLKRLARSSGYTQRDVDAYMALMTYTNELEKQVGAGTKYRDCFEGLERRRTEIVCMTWLAQTLCGSAIGGLGALFFQQAGISNDDSFKLNWGQNALGFLGTVSTWFILEKIGRRTLMIGGMCGMFVMLIIIGCMGIHTPPSTAESWTAGVMMVILSVISQFSIGPVTYTIVSEIPSSRLRAKSIIIGRNAYNIMNMAFVNVISYRQINPNEWNWGPKSGWFWAGINAIFTVYLFFRLPETKGRTFAELDILFENHIPARKFASTRIETLLEGTEAARREQADQIAAKQQGEQEERQTQEAPDLVRSV